MEIPAKAEAATRSHSNPDTRSSNDSVCSTTYEELMGISQSPADGGGASALTSRLVHFREWLQDEANAVVHPSVCIVNGEATDGTRNAPVLTFGPPPSAVTNSSAPGSAAAGAGRCGVVDNDLDNALYDRTIGCQVRVVRELKKNDVIMTIPREAMLTPDLVASSDAGRAVRECCKAGTQGFWEAFGNTTICERKFADKLAVNNGTQLLVKILQERKKAETAMSKALREGGNGAYKLAENGRISTRAPILAFLIHQRFSNEARPPVASGVSEHVTGESSVPFTFGPYVRTFPSVIPLPICWKRNELALLAGCIPGVVPLQEVAARTCQLASEFVALVEAGISYRFPDTFPKGLLTWERWVWAASVYTSRVLPVSCYLNHGEKSAFEHMKSNDAGLQSPPEVWNELGVMIPLLDMLNHEGESSQVTWEACVPAGEKMLPNGTNGVDSDASADIHSHSQTSFRPPQAVANRRVKKGSQIYCSYGNLSNQDLIMQYGFAQINNPADEVRLGWGLTDAVGNVPSPSDYVPSAFVDEGDNGDLNAANAKDVLVYESGDSESVSSWWSTHRLAILEKEALLSNSFMSMLKAGKKMTASAHHDGTFDPIFLSAAALGTMPEADVKKQLSREPRGGESSKGSGLAISRRHQRILRKYLAFIFTRKLEKLLQNLNSGLKDHFNNVQLWTKVAEGGLQYTGGTKDDSLCTGWQAFFDLNAYSAAMELEKKYYAVGPDSCVLALYDGHLRSLRASIDGVSSLERFEKGVVRQLQDLGFMIVKEEVESPVKSRVNERDALGKNGDTEEIQSTTGDQSTASPGKDKSGEKSSRRRNRRKGDRPPAVKLHIGNLAYTTSPANLFDYFAGIYGRENILECHIPTERGSGRSRGFGFVTMPESVAAKTLHSSRKHEIDGRLLKVAQSNSAGAGKSNRVTVAPVAVPGDRCSSCGYRPKYCTCTTPNVADYNGNSTMRGDSTKPPVDALDYNGKRASEDTDTNVARRRNSRQRRSYSRSSSPYRGSSRSNRNDVYDRGNRDYRRGRSRSRSLSWEGDRDRRRRRSRGGDRERSRERSRGGETWGWGRRWSRDRSHSEDRSRSRSYADSQSRRERKSASAGVSERSRGLSRSVSPHRSRNSKSGLTSSRKREGHHKKRSRSRSRGRSSRRKRRRHARSRSNSNSRVRKEEKY